MFRYFFYSQSGASLVEYAVALVIVTIVGSVAALGVSQNSGGLIELSANTMAEARTTADGIVE